MSQGYIQRFCRIDYVTPLWQLLHPHTLLKQKHPLTIASRK
jgi:hypothetical protein